MSDGWEQVTIDVVSKRLDALRGLFDRVVEKYELPADAEELTVNEVYAVANQTHRTFIHWRDGEPEVLVTGDLTRMCNGQTAFKVAWTGCHGKWNPDALEDLLGRLGVECVVTEAARGQEKMDKWLPGMRPISTTYVRDL